MFYNSKYIILQALLLWRVVNGAKRAIRYIYIDLGTNDGSSVDAFLPSVNKTFGGDATDGSNTANNSFFRSSSGAFSNDPIYDKRNYEIYAVEANPRYTPILLQQQMRYNNEKISKLYALYNGTGISTKNGVSHLILDCPGCDAGDAGSSLNSDSLSAVGKKVPIRTLDILTFFKKLHVHHDDFVFVKMDIEGFEYDIVRRLIVSGLLSHQIDKIAVEWHHNAAWVFGRPDPTHPQYEERLKIHNKYLKIYESIQWMCAEEDINEKFIAWG